MSNSLADKHKDQGNSLYAQGMFKEAIDEYTLAIIKNPSQTTFYSNRAYAHTKLGNWEHVEADAAKAIELDSRAVKGHYLKGWALVQQNIRLNEAMNLLRRAYELGIEHKVTFVGDILNQLRSAKKLKWFAI